MNGTHDWKCVSGDTAGYLHNEERFVNRGRKRSNFREEDVYTACSQEKTNSQLFI